MTGKGERVEWIIPSEFRDGREHTFYVEMACNGMFGVGKNGDDIQPPDMDRYFKLKQAEVVAVNLQARALKTDFWIIGGKATSEEDGPARKTDQRQMLQESSRRTPGRNTRHLLLPMR